MTRARAGRRSALARLAAPVLGASLFFGALWLLRAELRGYSIEQVWGALGALPATAVLLAALLTAADFVVLTGYDALGVRYAGKSLPYRRVAAASTTGYAFSQALGFPLLTGAPIRYRLYTGWGLERVDIARIVAFYTITYWIGFMVVGGVVFLVAPMRAPADTVLASLIGRPLGAALLTLSVGYLAWCARVRRPLRVGRWSFPVPTPRVALLQTLVAGLDWLLTAAVLWALLGPVVGLEYPTVLGIFLAAHAIGLLSQVPGGVGVFEAVVFLLLPATVAEERVLAALVGYRAIYYLLPLLVATAGLTAFELRRHRELAEDAALATLRAVSAITPAVLAGVTFLAGTLLLLSGVAPVPEATRAWVGALVPLPLFELSHFVGSLAGAGLLLLARGLQRRLDGAYHVAVLLVGMGALLSLSRGFGAAEAVPLLALFGALLASRREFHRKASLLAEPFTAGWITAITLVMTSALWLGLFVFENVDYTSELWWTFTLNGNAPRFLRGTVGAAALLALFSIARLLRPAPPRTLPAGPDLLDVVQPIVRGAPRASAHLALLGDKQILLSESRRSFLMYGVEANSWIVMGDPVGAEEEFEALAWRFREEVDRAGDYPVFYQVTPEHLPLYLELGLTLLKLGEEGKVPLEGFSLEGPRRKDLRQAVRKTEEAGGSFEVVMPEGVPGLLPELRRVSDSWLRTKDTREKAFSLGAFREDYLTRTPVALARVDGRIVGFANLWAGDDRTEFSADLMRYEEGAPRVTMDYLFAQMMLWGHARGYGRFGLGMAPLAGLDPRPLGPLWNRLGAAVFRHGEHFYNFQGLKAYKEKFDPVWEPRYLASPAGLALPRALTDVATLIAGGLTGLVTS